jgi:hypothetical protein
MWQWEYLMGQLLLTHDSMSASVDSRTEAQQKVLAWWRNSGGMWGCRDCQIPTYLIGVASWSLELESLSISSLSRDEDGHLF